MITTIIKTELAVEQLIQQFTAAWNIHDASSFAALFAENADFTNVFGQKLQGRVAIEKVHAQIFTSFFKESELTATNISVCFMSENLLAVDVLWTMVGAITPQGKPWPERKGLMNLVLKSCNENWLILIMHNMELLTMSLN